jgi:hypothetical protein
VVKQRETAVIHKAVESHLRQRFIGSPAPSFDSFISTYNEGWLVNGETGKMRHG